MCETETKYCIRRKGNATKKKSSGTAGGCGSRWVEAVIDVGVEMCVFAVRAEIRTLASGAIVDADMVVTAVKVDGEVVGSVGEDTVQIGMVASLAGAKVPAPSGGKVAASTGEMGCADETERFTWASASVGGVGDGTTGYVGTEVRTRRRPRWIRVRSRWRFIAVN